MCVPTSLPPYRPNDRTSCTFDSSSSCGVMLFMRKCTSALVCVARYYEADRLSLHAEITRGRRKGKGEEGFWDKYTAPRTQTSIITRHRSYGLPVLKSHLLSIRSECCECGSNWVRIEVRNPRPSLHTRAGYSRSRRFNFKLKLPVCLFSGSPAAPFFLRRSSPFKERCS